MEILYSDDRVCVCIKPAGVNSTDVPGGLPSLVRDELGGNAFTVHRLDAAVSGLMVLARTRRAASDLSEQIRLHSFGKDYMAVIHGALTEKQGRLCDLMFYDKSCRKAAVVTAAGENVQEAVLDYEVMGQTDGLSLVKIHLITGRTHQIRCQFSSRGYPLVGDKKYGSGEDACNIALWSCRVEFCHPRTGGKMEFFAFPPEEYPWNIWRK